jgi:hypothetical protein
MRGMLVVVLVLLAGVGGYVYYDVRRYDDLSSKLNTAEAANAKARQTVQKIWEDFASAHKVDRALEALRSDVWRISKDYAVARKVDALLDEISGEVEKLKKELAAYRKSGPGPGPSAAPAWEVELGFRTEGDTVVVLRYAGPSLDEALAEKTLTKPGRALTEAVKVNADNPKDGTATFNYALVRSPEGWRTVTLGGGKPPAVALIRDAADKPDWDLSPAGREQIAGLLRGR